MLATLPGVRADRSAGTAADTIRVRGIPLDGNEVIAGAGARGLELGARGHSMLGARWLDDDTLKISSFSMVARRDGRPAALPGFDPRRDSWFGQALATMFFAALGARPLARNDRNRLAAATTILTLPLAAGMLTLRARHRRSATARYVEQGEPGMIADAHGIVLDATIFASRFRQIALEDLSIDATIGGLRVGRHDATSRTLDVELVGQLDLAREVTQHDRHGAGPAPDRYRLATTDTVAG